MKKAMFTALILMTCVCIARAGTKDTTTVPHPVNPSPKKPDTAVKTPPPPVVLIEGTQLSPATIVYKGPGNHVLYDDGFVEQFGIKDQNGQFVRVDSVNLLNSKRQKFSGKAISVVQRTP